MSTESKGKQGGISSSSERKTDRQSPSDKGGKDRQSPSDKGGKTDNPPLRGARGVIYPTTYNGPIECQLLKYELF